MATFPAGRVVAQQQAHDAADHSSTTAPSVPTDVIIHKFAAKEGEFRAARDDYTYSQSVLIQDMDMNGRHHGEFRQDSDIIFTSDGKRIEKITYAPQNTLELFSLTAEDMNDIENIQPFVLTTQDLPKYDLQLTGRERIDEINTYVFQVAPKKIEKGQRYFQGTIWVDDQDLQIVKTYGKAVPDLRKGKDSENLFPKFETYRENIDGKYWFPTYTRADDVLHFSGGDARIHMIVRYTNYKQFKSTIKITPVDH